MAVSDEWKTMGDFAPGLDENRLPSTDALVGRTLAFVAPDGFRVVNHYGSSDMAYEMTGGPRQGSVGSEKYDAVEVRPGIFFVSFAHPQVPEGVVQVIDTTSGHFLVGIAGLTGATNNIDPKVEPMILTGELEQVPVTGPPPEVSLDLVGKRVLFRYSASQAYEHIYITSSRFAWHALQGPQAGHSDVELTKTYRITDGLYFFTWYEKIIPTCAMFVFDVDAGRSTGFFFGLGDDGQVLTGGAGAFFEELSVTRYPEGVRPA